MSTQIARIPCVAKIFVLINQFWLCAAVVSHSQPLSKWLRHNALKAKTDILKKWFWATSKHFSRSSLLEITKNQHLDIIDSDFHAIIIGKHGSYHSLWYNLKSCCISLVLLFALFQ